MIFLGLISWLLIGWGVWLVLGCWGVWLVVDWLGCLVDGYGGLYGVLNVFGKNDEKNPYESICVFAYVIVIRDKLQPFQFVEF